MNVLLISQCHKKALTETRRIIDQFAERCGDRTWQTAMTRDGLDTLRKLLRKTARKNTAVACYWTRGQNRTELLWIVGNCQVFNAEGRVPTNRTQRDVLRRTDEDSWAFSQSLIVLTVLAALLHDLGKSSDGFQRKLRRAFDGKGDPFRHEWVSLRIFQAIVEKAENDEQWLRFLADFDAFEQAYPLWREDLFKDGVSSAESLPHTVFPFKKMPPLARAVGWLIVSHHRLPFYGKDEREFTRSVDTLFEKYLTPVDGWVKNAHDELADAKSIEPFWTFSSMATDSRAWRRRMAHWAERALADRHLSKQCDFSFFDPLLMHLARLSLMAGDHNYSALPHSPQFGDRRFALYANTQKRDEGDTEIRLRQRLDEHLIGVAHQAERFSRRLLALCDSLPAIAHHDGFRKRAKDARFQWQNLAYEKARSLREKSQRGGFFGVNMASTGCGKTLGNGRIMYGLSDPERGARFTMALGLRVLTLQTGKAYQDWLGLGEDDLAILVGGQSVVDLFNLNNGESRGIEPTRDDVIKLAASEVNSLTALAEKYGAGSESIQPLEDAFIHYDSPIAEQELGTVLRDAGARKLLYAPVVTCTVDRLMGATETSRGGRFIVPLLRLLSSDLILDEPDDFNVEDNPALARLVNMAGMMGSRVLLSSATLPPHMLAGLFDAYRAGREIWNRHHGIAREPIACAWFDERSATAADCADKSAFWAAHAAFVQARLSYLKTLPVLRQAEILPLPSVKPERNLDYDGLAKDILSGAARLHAAHGERCPHSGKRVSFGLIRLSNINPLVSLAQALYCSEGLDGAEIHLCVYHARQLLALRSDLEQRLDGILNRKENGKGGFEHVDVKNVLELSAEEDVIFIVLATPVAEVGRDHDYDWAIVEPSSMRSLIQLAGRVLRHRNRPVTVPNILVMETAIRALRMGADLGVGKPVFRRPGFELGEGGNGLLSHRIKLLSHRAAELLAGQLASVHSGARIWEPLKLNSEDIPPEPKRNSVYGADTFSKLEHLVTMLLMDNPHPNLVNAWWRKRKAGEREVYSANPYLFHLQRLTPFRAGPLQKRYVRLLDDEGQGKFYFIAALNKDDDPLFTRVNFEYGKGVKPWLNRDYADVIEELGEELPKLELRDLCIRFGYVELDAHVDKWNYHPRLGFWPNI